DLIFPSGESLPRCWVDADYRYFLTRVSHLALP
ncbi:acetyltransferase, partial [Nostoc sp. HG1]|nr:acetyltransferase [Nostoc sp. HG1]